jgi:hypothetical protein
MDRFNYKLFKKQSSLCGVCGNSDIHVMLRVVIVIRTAIISVARRKMSRFLTEI